MKIHTGAAAVFYGGQIDRIEAGFVELGHEIVARPSEADLVYCNDTGHCDQIVVDRRRGSIRGKVIITLLDIPEHNLEPTNTREILAELENTLSAADRVCVISVFVQDQLMRYLKRESSVIYQPIKTVTRKPVERDRRDVWFASFGRRTDRNKRFSLGVRALQLLGVNYNQLALAGNDYMPWGTPLGVLSDTELDSLYNTVDFVFGLGRIEGMGLPALEGMAAGVIPILCNDLSTRQEFFPSAVFPEYDLVEPTPQSVALFIGRYMQDNDAMQAMKDRLHAHYLANWQVKLSGKGVAQAILDVYASIP